MNTPTMTFNERFAHDDEHNSFTLTADGCINRLADSSPFRDNELNSVLNQSFARNAEADERTLMNYVSILSRCGKQPMLNETLESFVIRNIELVSDYIYRNII